MSTIKLLFQLCLFRGRASALPYSPTWLIAVLLANFMLRIKLFFLEDAPVALGPAIGALCCSYALMTLFIYFILKGRSMQLRLLKTLIAYLGTEILFLLTTLVFFHSPQAVVNHLLLMIIFLIWNYSVKVSIVKQSLDAHANVGVILVITIEVLRVVPFVFFFLDQLVVQQGTM